MSLSNNDSERFNQFRKETDLIHNQLEQIANTTMEMSKLDIAKSSNPDFVKIMKNHQKLLDHMNVVINDYESYSKK